MIKKKLGKITFAWNPQALNGRGYWYVAGKNDTYARAASKMEASRLGVPKSTEMPPKNVEKENQPKEAQEQAKSSKGGSKFYFTTSRSGKPIRKRFKSAGFGQDAEGPSEYEMADVVRSKGLMQLASERMMSGEGIGKSLKGAISDKMKARATNLKKMTDPLNLLNKLPGIGKFAATAYGKKRGRSAADISYFTGIQAPTKMQEEKEESMRDSFSDDSEVTATKEKTDKTTNLAPIMDKMLTQLVSINEKISSLTPKDENEESKTSKNKTSSKVLGKKNDSSMTKTLDNLYNLFYERFEEEKKEKEIQDSFEEEKEQEEANRHNELIEAILKGMKPKEEDIVPEKEKGEGLFDNLFDIITKMKSLFSSVVSKVGDFLVKYGGQAVSAAKNLLPAAKSAASTPAAATIGTVALAGAVVYGGLKSAEMAGEKINKEIKEAAAAGDIKKLKFKVAESYEDEDYDTKLGYNPVTPTLDAMERKEVRAKLEEAANAGSKKAAEALTKLDSTYPKPVTSTAQKNKKATKQEPKKSVEQKSATPTKEVAKEQKSATPTKEVAKEQKSATPNKQPIKTSEKRTEEYIGGEKVIPGQPLSEKQMLAAKLNLESGGKLNPETKKSYDLAKKSGPRDPEMAKAKPQQPTKQTASPVGDKKTQTMEFIGGEKVIPGQPLSEKQMLAAKLNLESGGKLNPETKKSYDLAKQMETQPSSLGQRASAATQENKNLTGPSAQATPPVIVNKTTNVVNNGGGAGGAMASGAKVRNDESVLTRLQMQGARPV